MKIFSVFILVFLINWGNLIAQNKLSNFYFSYELSEQFHYNKINIKSPYVINEVSLPTQGNLTHMVTLGYKFNKLFGIETGYYWKFYATWVKFNFPNDYFWTGYGRGIEIGNSVPLRLVYTPVKFNLFKKPFFINTSVGCTIVQSGYYKRGPISNVDSDENFFDITDSTKYINIKRQVRYKSEAGIKPFFFFLEGRLQAEYQIFKFLAITGTLGFGKGFTPMGYYRGSYKLSEEPTTYQFENATFGDHIYRNIGVKLIPFAYKKSKK